MHKGMRNFVRAAREILNEVGVWAAQKWFRWGIADWRVRSALGARITSGFQYM